MFFLLMSIAVGQENVATDWIDVRGKTIPQIKKIISRNIKNLGIYEKAPVLIEEEKLKEENDDRKYNFNTEKLNLRKKLNAASSNKQISEINFIKAKDISNETYSVLKAKLQIVADSDSSITSNQKVIDKKKEEVEEELSKLPFQVVLLSVLHKHKGKNISALDAAMEYQMAKKAIESELGTQVISSSIIDNGILSEQRVKILLSGKVNSRLESKDSKSREEDSGGSIRFDRIRYGLTTVYPFEVDNNSLLKKPTPVNEYKIEVYVSSSTEAKKIAKRFNKVREIRTFEQSAQSKNIESESIIQRLGAEAKSFIESRRNEIKKAQKNKNIALTTINDLRSQIVELKTDSSAKANELVLATKTFNKTNSEYTNHIFSESYIYSETRFEDRIGNLDYDDQYIRSAESLIDLFLNNINTQIVKEESQIIDEQYSEFTGTKKDVASINAVKVLGKMIIEESDIGVRGSGLGISLAFDYGFTFKENDSQMIATETTNKINNRKPTGNNYTIKEMAAPSIDESYPILNALPDNWDPETGNKYTINFSSNPVGAEVFLSGQLIGITPFYYQIEPETAFGIVIKLNGFEDKTDVVSGKRGVVEEYHYELKRIKSKSGINKILIYTIVGGGVAYALSSNKEKADKASGKTGSLSVLIQIPN